MSTVKKRSGSKSATNLRQTMMDRLRAIVEKAEQLVAEAVRHEERAISARRPASAKKKSAANKKVPKPAAPEKSAATRLTKKESSASARKRK